MGLLGSGSKPGKGNSGKKCDYCGSSMDVIKAQKGPHIGNSAIMGHNRYFCCPDCMKNWKEQYNY